MTRINSLIIFKLAFIIGLSLSFSAEAQSVGDDFEGNGTITTWTSDDCEMDKNLSNPFPQTINTSAKVLKYRDVGGQYANVRFDVPDNFNLSVHHTFTFKIYVPSNGLTGTQTNKVSLKLQNGTISEPWTTQSEVIKPLILNQWQVVSFNFQDDPFFNFDPNSANPVQRLDFNRVLIQVNGENNNDQVLAYIDDVSYDGTIAGEPVYDQLIWADEFDGLGAINASKWFQQTQLPAGGSWYNGEIQHYTNRLTNSFIGNGTLKIVAKKEIFTSQGQTKSYTSARLNSKFAFTYGKVEFRAKLPVGIGTWPALWTLGKNVNENGGYWDIQGFGTSGWPACGEMDVMEHWGDNQNFVQSATHTPSSFGGTINKGGQSISTVSTDFHIYTLEWYPKRLVFSVDGVVHFIYNPIVRNEETWPFTTEQYLLMNVAIQGNISPGFIQSDLEVDYVRIYQANATTGNFVQVRKKEPIFYPNPFTDEIIIGMDAPAKQNMLVRIHTIGGKLVKNYNVRVEDKRIRLNDLGELAKGLYVVSFEANNQIYHLKLAKE